uniref:DnaJ (Hsp40) homolog, subfamily C, member 16 n=1 Tax=Cyprinodon variegatus TaxID=28743 RepID=A0A3Q2E3E6_CYPVA
MWGSNMSPYLAVMLLVVLCVLLPGLSHGGSEMDPYKILGVTRRASQAEIKKVYKRLAKEWHPDKNKDPGAEDMFIKIIKSYEILSSEDKRANYDRYGQTDDTQAYGGGRYGPPQDSFYPDESFFNFPFNTKNQRDFTDSKYTLHFNQYIGEVVPDSYRRPYLIKITSDWCFSCIHIEPVWKEVVQEMEGLGVGIGVVDVGYERRLANHLGAHRTPSILGVISGKVTFFHYAVAKEHLRQFVEDLLPQRLVERITDKNEQQFLNSWHALNKPHVLLFDQVPSVPLLYKVGSNTFFKVAFIGGGVFGCVQVVILERRNAAGKAFFKPVTAWNGSEEDKLRLLEELERLQKDPSILIHDVLLPELNNEFASMFVVRWISASYDYLSEIIDDILHNNWREMMPLLSLIFSALFILFGTVVIQAFSDSSEDKQMKPKAKDGAKAENGSSETSSASRPPKKTFVEVTELTDITYMSNLVKLRPGHINIVLVLTDASKNILLSKFAKEVYSFTGSHTLHFSFLNLDKHGDWMSALLEYAPGAAQVDDDEGGSRKVDYTGFVLALNGHKKYLCLFKPVYTGEDLEGKSSEDEAAPSAGRSRPGHPPRKSGRSRSTSTLQIHHKLDRLGLWMERLMEGTLPRFYVPAWPGVDKITPSK